MLISMTGHGQALLHQGPNQVFAEVRAVNNRFLKVHVVGELTAEQSAEVEQVLRSVVKRGSVTIRIEVDRANDPNQFRINAVAVAAYRQQLSEQFSGESIPISAILALPGAVEDHSVDLMDEQLWPTVLQAVELSVERLDEMRRREGLAMRATLHEHCGELAECVARVALRAPQVIISYRQRLTDRINQLFAEHNITAPQPELVKEVGLFAERADISEEIVRMRSHLQQCLSTLDAADGGGRKLDFLTQEMLREANTMGSKSNDAPIAQEVVEMKTIIERMRELVQNVE